jgi:hypothetical protein
VPRLYCWRRKRRSRTTGAFRWRHDAGTPASEVAQRPFLEEAFRTDYYRVDITFNGDDAGSHVTRTDPAVRGRTPPFNHRDTNTLRRIAAPTPNPLIGSA